MTETCPLCKGEGMIDQMPGGPWRDWQLCEECWGTGKESFPPIKKYFSDEFQGSDETAETERE